jgi:hypothetical protein
VSNGISPGPLRHLLAQLDELRPGDVPDMDKVGRLLVELASDQEYFAPLVARIPAGSPGVHWQDPTGAPAWFLCTGPTV